MRTRPTAAARQGKRSLPQQRSSTEFAEERALQVKLLLLPFSLVFLYLILGALVLRPLLTTGTLMWIMLVIFFLSSETSSNLHASQKTENKFWMLMSSVYSALLLFARDSPFKMKSDANGLAQALITLSLLTYLVHLWHKRSHRRYLENRRIHWGSILLANNGAGRTTVLLQQVNSSLEQLESAFVPGGVRRIFDRSFLLQTNEELVLRAFRDANSDELNVLVHQVNMNVCLYRLKNHHKASVVAKSKTMVKKDPPSPTSTTVEEFFSLDDDSSHYSRDNNSSSSEEEEEGEDGEDVMEDEDVVLQRDLQCRNNRNALVELLAKHRVRELNVESRTALLDAIQVVGMSRNPLTRERAMDWITSLVLNTCGNELVKLKQLMDSKGSIHSLHKLVYNDISDLTLREKLLAHFTAQSSNCNPIRKVLSDVDDTFICSGGRYPAGMDDTYPHHAIYPGASAFYSALGAGGNLAFLSARPHVYKDVAESRVYSKFERLIKSKKLHTMPTLLPGSLNSGQAYMLYGDYEPMAQKKLHNMIEYHSLYPEARLVFIGDNGQADVRAAELMVDKLGNKAMECVFIHQVQPLDKSFGYSQLERVKWGKFCFYKTIIGAAAFAYRRGMISPLELHQCMTSARYEFANLITQKFPRGVLGVETRRQELAQDFAMANLLLEGVLTAVAPPPALCMYPPGTVVYTKLFGKGIVKEFRAGDGMYRVELFSEHVFGCFTLLDLQTLPWPIGVMGTGLHLGEQLAIPVGSEVHTMFGEGVVRKYRAQDKVFEVVLTKWPAIAFLQESQLRLVEVSTKAKLLGYGRAFWQWRFAPQPKQLTVGTRVYVKPLGDAVVLHWREEDSIAHLRFASFETFTHISAILQTPPTTFVATDATTIVTATATTSEGSRLRSRTISIESIFQGAKQKVVAKLFSPKSTLSSSFSPTFVLHQQTVPVHIKPGSQVLVKPLGVGVVQQVRMSDLIVQVKFEGRMCCFAHISNCLTVPISTTLTQPLPPPPATASLYEKTWTAWQHWVSFEDTTMRVRTPYGMGTLCGTGENGVCKVKMDWGATAYLQPNDVARIARSGFLSLLSSPQSSPPMAPAIPISPAILIPPITTLPQVGDLVQTDFGEASVVDFVGGMVKVRFTKWNAIAVLREECVT
ncbi:hypothetical protein BASA81_009106 [Batrachochytrium salamandrivorans]|nr:hypothetical protein BASA81_009106 [Batrachochytrium salamandrivorans]